MKWITRRNLHIDRTASAWLICRFVDPDAEFVFVSPDTDPATLDGRTFDMRGAEYSHADGQCTFQMIVAKHELGHDPALVEMGRIILDADVPPSRTRRPEAAGIAAILTGFQMTTPDDTEKLRRSSPLYDALYAYCEAKIAAQPASRGTPRPKLSYHRRVEAHLTRGE
jgi:hypothetical protein